jgi:TRAP-type C4-dicarboxylate transport system permease small subunit
MERATWYEKIDKALHKVLYVFAVISSLFLIILMTVTAVNIVSRKLFQNPVYGNTEISMYAFLLSVALGLGYTEYNRGNVKVTIIIDYVPKLARKIIVTLMDTISGVFSLFVSYQMALSAISKFNLGDVTETLKMPVWIFCVVISLSFLTLALACLWNVVKEILDLHVIQIDTIQNAQVIVEEIDGENVIYVKEDN